MASSIGIATGGVNVLNFHALSTLSGDDTGLTDEEIIAVTAVQSAITLKAQERTEKWYHMDPKNPDTYKNPLWWSAISSAVTEDIQFASITSSLADQPQHRTINSSDSNIASTLRTIMQDYIPNASQAQLDTLIKILTGTAPTAAKGCLDSWSNNWESSLTYSAFGFGPAWKEQGAIEGLTNIITDISFFAVSVGHADWEKIFLEGGHGQLDIYVGKYRVEFFMGVYDFYKKSIIESILGGSPEERVTKAPFA